MCLPSLEAREQQQSEQQSEEHHGLVRRFKVFQIRQQQLNTIVTAFFGVCSHNKVWGKSENIHEYAEAYSEQIGHFDRVT
jgi:hypothetical protein